MRFFKQTLLASALLLTSGLLTQCGTGLSGNLGGPTVEERNAAIGSEPTGNFYYGRRYFVEKTRFWGYLRKPREPWSQAKLVIMREDKRHNPDRLSESGSPAYAFDANYEYRISGYYTGEQGYDPNSNQFLPVFMLTSYEVINRNPGWLFSPSDSYDKHRITMTPR